MSTSNSNNGQCCSCCCQGLNRDFSGKNSELRILLAQINAQKFNVLQPRPITAEEKSFPHYNASFTKGLNHDPVTGHLLNDQDYENLVFAANNNRQKLFRQIPLAAGSQIQFVDPFAGLASSLIGADTAADFGVPDPPLLSSPAAAAEIIENYCLALARDVPFNQYVTGSTHPILLQMIGFLSDPNVQANLLNPPSGGALTPQNLFRGSFPGSEIGPYVSQLMLLNAPLGACTVQPLQLSYPSKAEALMNNINIEWCLNSTQAIAIQNGQLSSLPPQPTLAQLTPKYLYAGRNLAETIHQDASIQFYFMSASILNALAVPWNPTLPFAVNQSQFITNGCPNAVQHSLADVCSLALKYAWFLKWNQFRTLRPEVFGLFIDNVKNNRVPNAGNYNIADFLFQNGVLAATQLDHAQWGEAFQSSFTLSGTFREGAPGHSAFTSGHSTVAGACCTILKLYFNAETQWNTISGLQSATINRRVVPVNISAPGIVQANFNGDSLENYTGTDINQMFVWSEINKLGCNVAMGRNFAGIHTRSDWINGMVLGEKIAESYFADLLSSWCLNNSDGTVPAVQYRRLDGTIATIKPSISSC